MIVVIPYCQKDQHLARLLVKWIDDLGGFGNRKVVLIRDNLCEPIQLPTGTMMKTVVVAENYLPWPIPHNMLFRFADDACKNAKEPWLWLETDVVPIRTGWLDEIEREYLECGKKCMGDRVQVADVPLHMSGVGVYPPDLAQQGMGMALISHEVAWDVGAASQIVPGAHWTKKIVHNWRHEPFKDMSEVDNLLLQHPEMALFHADKSGSLIGFLRQKRGDATCPHGVQSQSADSHSHARTSNAAPNVQPAGAAQDQMAGIGERSGAERKKAAAPRDDPMPVSFSVVCDIFIKSWIKDFEWLTYCVRSIQTFATGFRDVVLVSSEHLPPLMYPKLKSFLHPDNGKDGYLVQQAIKMHADTYSYAPYILHLDSDTIFTKPVTPLSFFANSRPYWLMTPYNKIEVPWKPIVERFLGQTVTHEFMRRQAQIIPRELYPALREFCQQKHGIPLWDYIVNQPNRAFSEFNVMGAFAWLYYRDRFTWIDTAKEEMPPLLVVQKRSWNAVNEEDKAELEQILAGRTHPKEVNAEKPVEPPSTQKRMEEPIPPSRQNIKVLPSGVWVIADDTHVSKWIEQEGRCDHDQNLLPSILPHIKEKDVVIDAGSFIGDHTIAYARKASVVHAFEPNPVAFQCLLHNAPNRVVAWPLALGDAFRVVELSGNNYNAAGAYLGSQMSLGKVPMIPLDALNLEPNFIKIDIEGCELRFLRGAEKTISRCYPIMVMEINYEALARQGDRVGEIYLWLQQHGYSTRIIQENCVMTSPMYDILCFWAGGKSGSGGSSTVAHPSAPPPKHVRRRRRKKKRQYKPEVLERMREKSRAWANAYWKEKRAQRAS